jgi:hypothetical protein
MCRIHKQHVFYGEQKRRVQVIANHQDQISGVLSGFDRLVLAQIHASEATVVE